MQFYDEIQSLEQSIFAMLKTIHGQGQTLTESKQEISQESNRIRAIVSALGEGVLVVDQDLMVTLANPIAIKLLNLPVEQIVGKKFNEFAEILQGDDVLPFDQWPVRQSACTHG